MGRLRARANELLAIKEPTVEQNQETFDCLYKYNLLKVEIGADKKWNEWNIVMAEVCALDELKRRTQDQESRRRAGYDKLGEIKKRALRMKAKDWWFQDMDKAPDTCCFVYAVANAVIHLGMVPPDIEAAKDIACCRTGSTVSPERVVETVGAPLETTDDVELVISKGGVLTIQHPIYNLHAVLAYPEDGNLVLVNALLGAVVQRVHPDAVRRLMPGKQNCKHWVFKSPV